ncbi:arsenate reductase [Peptoniphilus ivorii]|uniref:arsenate reductase ArsC n=1 Tax=Aedoeadaptatus ivorii TaxID=54006 RepID=UPI002789A1A6|nr:arsenate reductase ArsC [Peptoniphilus ivorii]MDQ0507565.1 arsenate reductase [Peptoniphilus ivorii]
MKTKVAFICVHNSCRSQIAEALAKKFGGDRLEVYSAGTEVKGSINPDAVRLMRSVYGIDMQKEQRPKTISEIPAVDLVITMGCNVVCPVLDYDYVAYDWGLDDPTGKDDAAFIETMRTIEKKVKDLVEAVETGAEYAG